MGRFYGERILRQEICPRTGSVWTIECVPVLFKKRTEAWLAENTPKTN